LAEPAAYPNFYPISAFELLGLAPGFERKINKKEKEGPLAERRRTGRGKQSGVEESESRVELLFLTAGMSNQGQCLASTSCSGI
jgi:hypothetical protein